MLESYKLDRNPKDRQLKAYNAADELFLKRLNTTANDAILIINDQFGALSVALSNHQPVIYSDSAMALEAIEQNCASNGVDMPNALSKTNSEKFTCIALVMPKSINYFASLLEMATHNLAEGGKVYVLTMVKHTSRGHIDVMNQLFKQVNPGRAEKKARVIELTEPTRQKVSQISHYLADELGLEITNLPGCYGSNGLDQGARVLLSTVNQMKLESPVLDLGCGNGVLSLGLLKQNAELNIALVDESLAAVQSAQQNLSSHFPSANVEFYQSNGMNSVPNSGYALILCNPPFHQEGTVTEGIANKLFQDMSTALKENGECWIVANRHLNYYKTLRRWFGNVRLASNDPKFNVFMCRK